MLKEEFMPMRFRRIKTRKIKLPADFSVLLQTLYIAWKDQNHTVES